MANSAEGPAEVSRRIDRELKKEKEAMEANIACKMVCLGPADSGKTTVIKQLRLLHGNGFTTAERPAWAGIVRHNIEKWGREFALLIRDAGDISRNAALERTVNLILRQPETPEPKSPLELTKEEIERLATPECRPRRVDAEKFTALATVFNYVKDSLLQHTSAFRSLTSAHYFFNDLERICKDDYEPTDDDILKARVRTHAVTRYAFVVGDMPLWIYDIGGHRSQRPRWTNYFDDVEAVLFVAAVSSYDQTVEEDPGINRIVDSLALFESVVNHTLLKSTSIILFLNKIDLLKAKMPISPVKKYIPAYEGKQEYNEVCVFLKTMFNRVNKSMPDQRVIYTHFTYATDTKSMKAILQAMTDILRRLNLQESGF